MFQMDFGLTHDVIHHSLAGLLRQSLVNKLLAKLDARPPLRQGYAKSPTSSRVEQAWDDL